MKKYNFSHKNNKVYLNGTYITTVGARDLIPVEEYIEQFQEELENYKEIKVTYNNELGPKCWGYSVALGEFWIDFFTNREKAYSLKKKLVKLIETSKNVLEDANE